MKNLTHICLQLISRRPQQLFLLTVMLMVLPLTVKPQYNTPTIDGSIKPGEYGVHTDGFNQQTTTNGTWYMAWDTGNLYIAYTGPKLTSGKTGVVYLNNDVYWRNDFGPSYGSYQGQLFNNTQITFIGQRSDAVIYFSRNNVEISRADGGGAPWATNQNITGLVTYGQGSASSTVAVYEIAIPWYLLDYGTPPIVPIPNPANLGHLEYVVNSAGNVSGQAPTNPGGPVGLYSSWLYNYYVNNTNSASDYPFGNMVGWYPCYFDGTVTEDGTGLPLANSDILFISGWGESYPVKTDASGYYSKIVPDNVTIPNYIIIAGHAGYVTQQVNTSNCGGTFDFQLKP